LSTLNGFPFVSQLTTVTGDGRPSENAQYDCVAASIDAACRYLLNQPENSIFNPDNFKDKAYGETWENNGTAAGNYVEFCKSLGINLYPFNGTPGLLVQHIHEQLAQYHPCIVTVPDIYVPSSYGWTHVLCMFAGSPGYLTALDPWPGKPTTKSDAEWLQLLLDNEIWIVEKTMIDINTPGVSNFFEPDPAGGWKCKQTGKNIHGEILATYQGFGNNALCGLTWWGLPVSNEIPLPGSKHGAVKQHFEDVVAFFDPGHEFDQRPGATDARVYLAHIYSGYGQDPKIAELEAQAGLDPKIVQTRLQAIEIKTTSFASEIGQLATQAF
jgi:hypothetical protein